MLKKSERRQALLNELAEHPFMTDEQLADMFSVSVATIRLDRAALQIPEARERIRAMAEHRHDTVRALLEREVIGDVTELVLNRFGVSLLEVTSAHVFSRTRIMRGHYLFGQVNSLAVAVMDASLAVTAKTELRFYRRVFLGETLRARVDVIATRAGVAKCHVYTQSAQDRVLDGHIWVSTENIRGQVE